MGATTDPGGAADWRVRAPDDVLLRRFGYVRAVGGFGWFVAVVVLWFLYGVQVWPLALGVPIFAVVTTLYFVRSRAYPRVMVTVSLVADAVVLAGAVAFFGGTGAGMLALQAIVIVSAGLLLGPSSAVAFTLLGMALGVLQLGLEQLGLEPVVLHRPELSDRVPVLLASCALLASVGYLAATYGGRLHELIALAGVDAAAVRDAGRRRRRYVEVAVDDVAQRVADLESIADEAASGPLDDAVRTQLAGRLRVGLAEVAAGVGEVADAAQLDRFRDTRPEPLVLPRVVEDCRAALAGRLVDHALTVDVPEVKVLGDARAARRVVFNLLENVADHTPPGTRVHVAARVRGWRCVLAVTDAGPGVPSRMTEDGGLFDPGDRSTVGLPLVRELCEAMGADLRYERPSGGGSRFLVAFRLAPQSAPSRDERGAPEEVLAPEETAGS